MFDKYPPKSVVVGVDGSQAAVRAARWAVDEVAGTDIPLCLLYVTEANPSAGPREARAALVAAEEVVHGAHSAIEQMGKPLKVEMEIVDGQPVPALLDASRCTALLCVGDTGSGQRPDGWIGSTARDLALGAHCSVVIVRGEGREAGTRGGRCIVARVDESPDDLDVLDLAINEALRRHAALWVVTAAQSRSKEVPRDRRGCVALDVLLTRLADDYPEVEIDTISLEGSFLDYLAEHAASIQLVMISSARAGEVQQLLGAAGAAALRGSDFSLLVVGLERPGR